MDENNRGKKPRLILQKDFLYVFDSPMLFKLAVRHPSRHLEEFKGYSTRRSQAPKNLLVWNMNTCNGLGETLFILRFFIMVATVFLVAPEFFRSMLYGSADTNGLCI